METRALNNQSRATSPEIRRSGGALRGIFGRIFSRDHRTIARQYFFLSLVAVILGVLLSLLMRFHLVHPTTQVGWLERLWPV
jgi:hypothetical protein